MVVQVTELKCQKLSQVPNSRGNWRFINYKGKLYPLAKNKQTRNQTKKYNQMVVQITDLNVKTLIFVTGIVRKKFRKFNDSKKENLI